MKTAEEIIKETFGETRYKLMGSGGKSEIINAMESYASQFKSNKEELPHGNIIKGFVDWIIINGFTLNRSNGFYYLRDRMIGDMKKLKQMFKEQKPKAKFNSLTT